MRQAVFFLALITVTSVSDLHGQSAVDVKRPEQAAREHKFVEHQEEKKAQATNLEIRGATAFKEEELRSILKEEIATIHDFGLTAARADDAAFFLALAKEPAVCCDRYTGRRRSGASLLRRRRLSRGGSGCAAISFQRGRRPGRCHDPGAGRSAIFFRGSDFSRKPHLRRSNVTRADGRFAFATLYRPT